MMRSIRWRLTLSYVALALVTAVTVGLLTLFLIRSYTLKQEREYLAVAGRSLSRQVLPLLRSGRGREEMRRLVETTSFLSSVRIRVLDGQRQLLVDSGEQELMLRWSGPALAPERPIDRRQLELLQESLARSLRGFGFPGPLPDPERGFALMRRPSGPLPPQIVLESLGATGGAERTEEQKLLHSDQSLILPVGDANRPYGFVEISQGPDFRRQTLAAALRAIAISAAAAVALAVLIGLLMSRKLSAPLVRLTAAVGSIDGDNFNIRVNDLGEDEIGRLSRQFNRMAERLGQSFRELARERDSLRQFAADASHELRTPLTALKTYNELLQSAAGGNARARREFLQESQAMLERLEWIVRSLLDLSRYDAGIYDLDVREHRAGDILRAALKTHKQAIAARRIAVAVQVEDGEQGLACDRRSIEAALSNLLDNSLKVLETGGKITLGARRQPQGWRLWVKDTGPGIEERDLPYIFNRFYRGRGSSTAGCGLGLAIVKSVVEAHGGTVEARSSRGEGSELILHLPLLQQIRPGLVQADQADDNRLSGEAEHDSGGKRRSPGGRAPGSGVR